jgi:hypothetical protein
MQAIRNFLDNLFHHRHITHSAQFHIISGGTGKNTMVVDDSGTVLPGVRKITWTVEAGGSAWVVIELNNLPLLADLPQRNVLVQNNDMGMFNIVDAVLPLEPKDIPFKCQWFDRHKKACNMISEWVVDVIDIATGKKRHLHLCNTHAEPFLESFGYKNENDDFED